MNSRQLWKVTHVVAKEARITLFAALQFKDPGFKETRLDKRLSTSTPDFFRDDKRFLTAGSAELAMAVPQPAYILRGHSSQIHASAFIRSNSRLVTGDAEGWLVLWDLAVKRPVAVWRAHEGSILGVDAWGEERLIT